METQLIQLYVLVCLVYHTQGEGCFQRTSNNGNQGQLSDQEIITIYWFGQLSGHYEKKAIHKFTQTYWLHYFPKLSADQTFVARLNRLEASFHTLGAFLRPHLPAIPPRKWIT